MAAIPHKRLLLVGDERKGGSKALIQHHATWLTGRGCHCEIVMDRDSSLAERDADCVVVWGGDGSLLGAARRMGLNQRPTLGINRGRLGFLTSFEYEQTQQALDMLLAGELREETRLKLPEPVLRGGLKDQAVFDDPDRSMRGRTITHGFHFDFPTGPLPAVRGSDDAARAKWLPVAEVMGMRGQLFEDHYFILERFLGAG